MDINKLYPPVKLAHSFNDIIKNADSLLEPEDDWTEKNYRTALESIKKQLNTVGTKKMWNSFFDAIRKKVFRDALIELRNECNIPSQGYNQTLTVAKIQVDFKKYRILSKKIDPFIQKTCYKYGFNFNQWKKPFEEVVFYGGVVLNSLCGQYAYDMIIPFEIAEKESRPFLKKQKLKKLTELKKSHPLVLFLHPETSKTALINFVENNKNIYYLLNKYKDKKKIAGKSREKDNPELTDFIIKNRNKYSLKNLAKETNKKFGTNYGPDEISKKIKRASI